MSDPVARLNAALKGRYAIERELGDGGMATVYLADDLKHELPTYTKSVNPPVTMSATAHTRWRLIQALRSTPTPTFS